MVNGDRVGIFVRYAGAGRGENIREAEIESGRSPVHSLPPPLLSIA